MSDTSEITLDTTVNDAVLKSPVALAIFARHGIDTCCGGALPIREVARRHHLDAEKLLESVVQKGQRLPTLTTDNA
jgi:regulator of cell morphogenesis and NO signaling